MSLVASCLFVSVCLEVAPDSACFGMFFRWERKMERRGPFWPYLIPSKVIPEVAQIKVSDERQGRVCLFAQRTDRFPLPNAKGRVPGLLSPPNNRPSIRKGSLTFFGDGVPLVFEIMVFDVPEKRLKRGLACCLQFVSALQGWNAIWPLIITETRFNIWRGG